MWILSTLGSLALTAYRATPAVKAISKAVKTPKKTSSGGSFVSKAKPQQDEYSKLMKEITPTLESLDDNTKMTIWWDMVEARSWVKTWIWFGEGQTVDSIMNGYDVAWYRTPTKTNPLYSKAVEEVKSIENNGSYEMRRAKQLDSSWTDFFTGASRIFQNTKDVGGKSISELKIARDKAVKDVVDFKNPNSSLHQTFKKNIESQGYDYAKDFSEYVSDVKNTTELIKGNVGWMKDYVNEERGMRGLRTLPIINAAVNKITWGEYNKYLDSIDQAKIEWDKWIIEDWTTPTANLLWGWLLYGWIGRAVNLGTVGLLNEGWFAVGWRIGWSMVTSANRIRAIEQASPTLYAIAVDNPLTTVIDYGVTKSLGGKYSGEDVAQSLITGTALPLILKWATSSFGGIWKWLTTKSLNEIDSQVAKLTKDGAMTSNDAIIQVAKEYEIEPWKTIMDAMDEAEVSPRSTIAPEETRSSLAQRGVSVSSTASKKIATVLNNLNKKIDNLMGKEEVWGGYGELWESGKAQQSKAAIIANLDEAKVVDWRTADEAIKNGLESNGLKYTASKGDVPIKEWEVLDDALHNPKFSWSKLKEAEDMDSIWEAVTWAERNTPRLKEIASARADVSVWTKDAETQVRNIATKSGIDIDERKLVTKVDDWEGWTTFVLNKKYAEDVLYRAEVKTTGYTPAKSTALSRTKRLISEGTTTLRKWMNNFSRTLKLGATEWKRMVTKNGDELYNSSSYSHLPQATRRRIIDSALKSNDGSIASLEKRIAVADEKLHVATFNKLEKDVDDLIKDIKKKSKSRTKKNTIDIGKEEEMILAYNDFAEAKLNGDLVWMKDVYDNLKLFEKEGRSIYKEDLEIRKESTRISTTNVLTEMELQWIDEFEARIVNTPSSGTAGQRKGLMSSVGQFFEDMLPTHEQFVRYFGKDSVVTQKMYKVFSAAESKTQLTSHKLMGNWQSTFKAIKKWISGDDDSLIQQFTLWRNSKSTFNTKQWVMSGHDYNMKNDMIGYYDKNGNPQIITVRDGDAFRAKNADKIKSGEYIDFWSKTANEVSKEDFLNKMYGRFDNLYTSSKAFKEWEDFFRNHFDSNGKKNASVMRRVYNKKMDIVDMYNPIYIYGKSHNDLNLWEVGDLMGDSFRDTIDASHTLSRIWPWQDVRMVLDFSTLLERHINWSVHWGNMIEPLNEAEAMFRMMKKGKSFIRNAWEDADNVIAKEMGFSSQDGADPFATMMGKWDVYTSNAQAKWERLMTPEVERFLSENLKKFATRSGSISGAGVQVTQNKTLGQFMGRAYKTMLTWWTTGAKQVLSDIDISTLAGAKNWTTSTRSIWLHGNFKFLLDESGHLLDRQAERFSGAHGKKVKIMWARSTSTKIIDALDAPADLILGNVIKWVDWGMSAKALLWGISKVLDEKYPNLHTAWKDLDLRKIKERLSKVDYVDWVRIVDDSEWRSVLSEWELFMHQVMGSNSMIDDALGSKGALGKMAQFMGKAATNRVIVHWDSMVHNAMQRQLAGRVVSWDAADKARTMAYWVTWSAIATAYSEWLKSMNTWYDVWSWKKSEEEAAKSENPIMKLASKRDVESFIAFWNAWFESQFFQPQTTLDVLKGYEWVSTAIKDFKKQESTDGMIRAGWAIAASIVPVHGRVTDAFKKGVNDLTWFDMRRSWLNDESKSWASVKKSYGDKWDSLTQSQKDELIAQQNKISGYSAPVDAKTSFLKNLATWTKVLNEQEFEQAIRSNPDVLKEVKSAKDAQSLYDRYKASMAKTSWEKDSLLMGKSVETIYNVEIIPLMQQWKAGDAFERVKELRAKWVIKSDKWAIQILQNMKEYQSMNK